MFAPAVLSRTTPNSHAAAGVYRQIGVETGIPDASPHRLIAMLFEGFNDSVAQAFAAMQNGQYEAKGRAIGRSVRIVDEGLKAALDARAGGKLAENLGALYAYVSMRLTQANLQNDPQALEECVRLMEPLRTAWVAIGPVADAASNAR
jgi:flagellar protein FliS